jgi:hypothetical protein
MSKCPFFLIETFRKNEGSMPFKQGGDRVLTAEQEADLALGRADTTTPVKVSVTVYTSKTFRYQTTGCEVSFRRFLFFCDKGYFMKLKVQKSDIFLLKILLSN